MAGKPSQLKHNLVWCEALCTGGRHVASTCQLHSQYPRSSQKHDPHDQQNGAATICEQLASSLQLQGIVPESQEPVNIRRI